METITQIFDTQRDYIPYCKISSLLAQGLELSVKPGPPFLGTFL